MRGIVVIPENATGADREFGAGKVDAATGFWNAEGVSLRRAGVPAEAIHFESFEFRS